MYHQICRIKVHCPKQYRLPEKSTIKLGLTHQGLNIKDVQFNNIDSCEILIEYLHEDHPDDGYGPDTVSELNVLNKVRRFFGFWFNVYSTTSYPFE